MNWRLPHTTLPIGQASPFDRHTVTESAAAASAAAGVSRATAALNSRAPSRCTPRPAARAAPVMAAICALSSARPELALCVFSMHSSRVRGQW